MYLVDCILTLLCYNSTNKLYLEGGFGEKIARFYGDSDVKVLNYGVKKELLDRYDIEELLKKNHLTVQQIVGDLKF